MSISNLTSPAEGKEWSDITVEGLTIPNGPIVSAQFNPVISNQVNITSTTNLIAWYTRVGRAYTIYIGIEILDAASGVITSLDFDLSMIPGFSNAFNAGPYVSKDQPGLLPPADASIPGTGVIGSGGTTLSCSYTSTANPPVNARLNIILSSFGGV